MSDSPPAVSPSAASSNAVSPGWELCRSAVTLGFRHFLRHFIGLGLVFATLSASFYFTVDRVGSSLKHVLEQKLNQTLVGTGCQVQFDSLQFVDGEGIRFRGVRLRLDPSQCEQGSIQVPIPMATQSPGNHPAERHLQLGIGLSSTSVMAPNQSQPLVSAGIESIRSYRPNYRPIIPQYTTIEIDSVWLRGQWNTADLLQGKFEPDAVELDGVVVSLQLDPDQQLRLPKVLELSPATSQPIPLKSLHINSGQVRLLQSNGAIQHEISRLQFHLTRPSAIDSTLDLSAWRLGGELHWISELPLQISADFDQHGYRAEVRCRRSHWHSNAWKSIAPFLPFSVAELQANSGWVEIEQAQMSGSWPTTASSVEPVGEDRFRFVQDWSVRGQLSEVNIQHPLLPQPIYNAAAKFEANVDGLYISEYRGTVADGEFHGQATLQNWLTPRTTLEIHGRRLNFTERWTSLLSEKLKAAWDNFQPQGELDCDLVFVLEPDGTILRRGNLDVRNLSYVYHDFPLPVSKVGGRFILNDNDCQFQLESHDPRCPVTISGFANDMGPAWTGRVDIRSTKYHSYSDELLLGIRKKPEVVDVVRQMNLSGQIAVNGFIEKSTAHQPADVRFNIGVHAGEVRHRLFPYRIFGLSGSVQFLNGAVSTDYLEGVSSTGNIRIRGQSIPQKSWWVEVIGQAVELNQELYQAMSPAQQIVWDQINPRGELDQVLVRFVNDGQLTSVDISGFQQPSTAKDPSNLRIEPTWFPYALERLSGKFHYNNGQLTINSVQGWHGTVPVSFDVAGVTKPDSWQISLNNILTGQIPIDHDIKQALPQSVRDAADRVNMSGSMAVHGSVLVSAKNNIRHIPGQAPPSPTLHWNLRLDLENAALDVGLPVQNVHGSVNLNGQSFDPMSHNESFSCQGNLQLDSLMVRGIQLTSMAGPFWSNDQQLRFGAAIDSATNRATQDALVTPASITANSLGGRIGLDGQVLLRDEMHFHIQTTAHHIDLAKLAAHWAPETREIAGLGSAYLALNGSSIGSHSLDGNGVVRIYKAKLYEIPVFLQLLKTLQVRTPDKTAFDEGLIDFDIRGTDIECQRIELNGDAISLIGNGRANLDQEVDLNFYTVLGRNRFYLPVLTDLLHAGSQQLMWISVKGPADKPVLTRETFRALNEAVRQLLEEPPRQFPFTP